MSKTHQNYILPASVATSGDNVDDHSFLTGVRSHQRSYMKEVERSVWIVGGANDSTAEPAEAEVRRHVIIALGKATNDIHKELEESLNATELLKANKKEQTVDTVSVTVNGALFLHRTTFGWRYVKVNLMYERFKRVDETANQLLATTTAKILGPLKKLKEMRPTISKYCGSSAYVMGFALNPKSRITKMEKRLARLEALTREAIWYDRNRVAKMIARRTKVAKPVRMRKVVEPEIVSQSGCKEPTYSKDDLCQRFARLGLKNFKKSVDDNWDSFGKSEKSYKKICKMWHVNPIGRTEKIPTMRWILNLCRRDKVTEEQVSSFVAFSVLTPSRDVNEALAIAVLHSQLKSRIGYIVTQGAVASSNEMSNFKDYDKLSTNAKSNSLFNLPVVMVEQALGGVDELVMQLGLNRGLPSIRWSEWIIIIQFLKNPDAQTFLNLQSTPFVSWVLGVLDIPYSKLLEFLFPSDDVLNGKEPEVIEEEEIKHQVGNPLDILQLARNSPMWKKISTMVFYIIGSKFLTGTALGDAISGSLNLMSDMIGSTVDGVLACNDAISYIFKRLSIVLVSGDIKDFFELDPVTVAVTELQNALQSMGRKDHLDPRHAIMEAELIATRHTKNTHPNVVSALNKLFNAIALFKSVLHDVRKKPAMYVFVGPPGLGKSMLTNHIVFRLKRMLGIADDINIVFTYQEDCTHQTLPAVTHVISLNDYFSLKDEKANVNPLTLIQRIADTTLLKMETASLEEKANSILAPKLGVVTTNTEVYEFTSAAQGGPCKMNRRIIPLLFILKASYIKKFKSYEEALIAMGENFDLDAVEYRFGQMNIPTKSNKMDLSLEGKQTVYEERVYDNSADVVTRILEHTMVCMNTNDVEFPYVCEKCGADSEANCLCNTTKMTEAVFKRKQKELDVAYAEKVRVANRDKAVWKKHYKDEEFKTKDLPKVQGYLRPSQLPVTFGPEEKPSGFVSIPLDVALRQAGLMEPDVGVQDAIEEFEEGTLATGEEIHNQGGGMSVPVEVKINKKDLNTISGLGDRILSSLETVTSPDRFRRIIAESGEAIKKEVDDLETRMGDHARTIANWAIGLSVAGALLTFLGIFYKNYMQSQGATVSSLVNVPKPDHEVIPTYFGSKLPWHGNSVLNRVTTISWVDGPKVHTRATWYSHNLLIVPYHFFRDSHEHVGDLKISYGATEIIQHISSEMYVQIGLKDAAVLFVPGSVGIFDGACGKLPKETCVPQQGFCLGEEVLDLGVHNFTMLKGTLPNTKDGDCGSPLYDKHGNIYGIFIGYYTKTGTRLWTALTSVDMMQAVEALREKGVIIEESVTNQGAAMKMLAEKDRVKPGAHPKGVFAQFRNWERPNAEELVQPIFHTSTKATDQCKVKPTVLRKEFTNAELPEFSAPFFGKVAKYDEDGETKYNAPLLKQLRAALPSYIKKEWGEEAVKSLCSMYVTKTKIQPISLWTSVCGSKVNSLINARDNSKSLGPSVHYLYGMSKDQAFQKIGDSFKMDERLIRGADEWYEHFFDFKTPVRPIYVRAARKAELKEKSKAEKGDARLFSVCDIEFQLAYRRLILPIIQHFLSHPYESGVFGCLNAGGVDWPKLFHWLDEFKRTWESDQKTMDGRHKEANYWYVKLMYEASILFGYTKDQARALARAIMCTLCYYMEVDGDWLFFSWRLNSGLADTLTRNSVIGLLLLFIVFAKHGKLANTKIRLLDGTVMPVREGIRPATCGDDNITAVHPKVDCSGIQLIADYKELGYELTRADKMKGEVDFQPMTKCTFLKRSFVPAKMCGKDVVLAPLEMKSILKSICYSVNIGDAELEARNRNAILCAVKELFLHGKEVFESYVSRIAKHVSFELPTYKRLEEMYVQGVFEVWEADFNLFDASSRPKLNFSDDGTELGEIVNQSGGHPPNYSRDGDTRERTYFTAEINDNQTNELENNGTVAHLVSSSTESAQATNKFLTTRVKPSEVSIKEFFERPRKVGTLLVGSSAFLAINAFPQYNSIATVRKFTSQWQLFRGNCQVRVMVTGSSNYCGKVRLYAYPNVRLYTDYGWQKEPALINPSDFGKNFVLTSQLPHVDMDLSLTGEYRLTLGWPMPFDYLDTSVPDTDWKLGIVMVNAAWTTNGATFENLPIDVYISYHDVVLDYITNQSGEVSGNFSRGLSYAAWAAKFLPFPWANPFSKVLAAGSELASKMGYSRLPMEAQTIMISRAMDNLNVIEGQFDAGQTLGTCDVALTGNVRSAVGEYDDDTIAYIVKKKCMVIDNWQANVQITVNPCVQPNLDAVGGTIGGGLVPLTPLGHLSLAFRKWTGSMVVCVEVVASPLIRGRLGIVTVPPYQTAPASFPTDGSFLTTQFDIAGSTCIEVTVPYLYKEPFQYTDQFLISGGDSSATRIVYFWIAGPFDLGATRKPDINLYMWGGPDLVFAVPDLTNAHDYEIMTQCGHGEIHYQSGVDLQVFGEKIVSLRELSRRKAWHRSDVTVDGGDIKYSTWPLIPAAFTPTGPETWTFAQWLTLPYHAIGGSLSYTFRAVLGTGKFRVHESISGSSSTANMSAGYVCSNNDVAQVRVPNRSSMYFWSPYRSADTAGERSLLTLKCGVAATTIETSLGGDTAGDRKSVV